MLPQPYQQTFSHYKGASIKCSHLHTETGIDSRHHPAFAALCLVINSETLLPDPAQAEGQTSRIAVTVSPGLYACSATTRVTLMSWDQRVIEGCLWPSTQCGRS